MQIFVKTLTGKTITVCWKWSFIQILVNFSQPKNTLVFSALRSSHPTPSRMSNPKFRTKRASRPISSDWFLLESSSKTDEPCRTTIFKRSLRDWYSKFIEFIIYGYFVEKGLWIYRFSSCIWCSDSEAVLSSLRSRFLRKSTTAISLSAESATERFEWINLLWIWQNVQISAKLYGWRHRFTKRQNRQVGTLKVLCVINQFVNLKISEKNMWDD